MQRDVDDYISECLDCRKAKTTPVRSVLVPFRNDIAAATSRSSQLTSSNLFR